VGGLRLFIQRAWARRALFDRAFKSLRAVTVWIYLSQISACHVINALDQREWMGRGDGRDSSGETGIGRG
jgi:hypothetical protein